MKKVLLIAVLFFLSATKLSAQSNRFLNKDEIRKINVYKIAARESFPTDFKLNELDVIGITQVLSNAPQRFLGKTGVIISIPNLDGEMEAFEMFEASNFEPALQAQYPNIRSYAGTSLKNRSDILRLSVGTTGINTMVLRVGKEDEFMEPYSDDLKIYAIYNRTKEKGNSHFHCSTDDEKIVASVNANLAGRSSNPQLLTFRLALSCTGEYGAFFGGVTGALNQMNITMTRVNGVFEKDLTIRMNIIANNSVLIYTNAATDPYSVASVGTSSANVNNANGWNIQLQNTLTSVIGNANYDIGHLFGASGDGGNAGCIGCVCRDDTASLEDKNKGSGFTSPGSGSASGDKFDIDYVAHEMGHQFGGNHTFSHNIENTGVNIEPGSGSTVMAYAGITGGFDVQANSNAYFHYASINQIELNMVGKTCPVRTNLTNRAPIVDAGIDYTIPISTPFVLTGTASDPDGNTLNFCWEQNDSATSAQTQANSPASPLKSAGPNWRSYTPVAVPERYFPPLTRVAGNFLTTEGLQITTEAVSDIDRNLNFVFTARDNVAGGGLSKTDAMKVTVTSAAGPFLVTAPDTAISWVGGTNQTVTWNVAGTTANGVNARFVDIFMSTNGGLGFPTLLASKVPNDGSETITVPNTAGTTNRIMVKGNSHVFYDMSNINFTTTTAGSSFSVRFLGTEGSQNKGACQGSSASYTIVYQPLGGFTGTTNFSVAGLPSGITAQVVPTSLSAGGNVTITLTTTASTAVGLVGFTLNATSGATTRNVPLYIEVINGNFGVQSLTSPANNAVGQPVSTPLSWPANSSASGYDVQVATDVNFTNLVASASVVSTNYTVNGLVEATSYFWRVAPKNVGCAGSYSAAFRFTTGQTVCNTYNATNMPIVISASGSPTINSIINIPAGASISDVNVTANVTHSSVNELTAVLSNPNGVQVFLLANPCAAGNQNFNVTFDDAGLTTYVCGSNPAISGTIKPLTELNALNGDNSTGNWTLQIFDGTSGNGGTLNSWSLNICGFQALSNSSNEFKDFVIRPNPSKGIFNVAFNSSSNEKIKVAVYDMSGRNIFDKYYTNNGAFSQEIELNNVAAGVYLLNVQDGINTTTKRIVVE
jgi:subtilisin-like proprotein convertase family protein